MRNILGIIIALGMVLLLASMAFAGTASQTVTYGISGVQEISVTGSPNLSISAAVAGENPTSVSDSTSTYSFTTNKTGQKITGSIPINMPEGLTLSATFADPGSTWTSASEQPLGTAAVTLASGGRGSAKNKMLTYTLSATPDAVEITGTKLVTYTLLAL